jgi:RNA polymerase sigma-70 factor (ECF subfamily)
MTRPEIEVLYRRHGPMVLRRARALLGDEASARDALQEVFVRALQAEDTFRGEASPTTWLYRVTTNLCLNRLRDEARRRAILSERGAEPGRPVDAELRTTLARLLDRISPDLCEVAVYYYLDQMSHEEIAAVLGVSRRTVGNRVDAFLTAAREAQGVEA